MSKFIKSYIAYVHLELQFIMTQIYRSQYNDSQMQLVLSFDHLMAYFLSHDKYKEKS